MLGVNLSEPLAEEWPFGTDLRREAGAAFKINGQAPTWTSDRRIETATTVPQVVRVNPDSGALTSGNIDGSQAAHGANIATTSSSAAAATGAPQEIGLVGPNEAQPIHVLNASSESKAPPPIPIAPATRPVDDTPTAPPPTKALVAPAAPAFDNTPADAAKKRASDKREKAAQQARDLGTTISHSPECNPKKKQNLKKKRTKKTSDAVSESTATPIASVDTTMLIKRSLREHYWQPVKVREVKLVRIYYVGITLTDYNDQEYEPSISEEKLEVENSPAASETQVKIITLPRSRRKNDKAVTTFRYLNVSATKLSFLSLVRSVRKYQ